jgi:hypothetical protein
VLESHTRDPSAALYTPAMTDPRHLLLDEVNISLCGPADSPSESRMQDPRRARPSAGSDTRFVWGGFIGRPPLRIPMRTGVGTRPSLRS